MRILNSFTPHICIAIVALILVGVLIFCLSSSVGQESALADEQYKGDTGDDSKEPVIPKPDPSWGDPVIIGASKSVNPGISLGTPYTCRYGNPQYSDFYTFSPIELSWTILYNGSSYTGTYVCVYNGNQLRFLVSSIATQYQFIFYLISGNLSPQFYSVVGSTSGSFASNTIVYFGSSLSNSTGKSIRSFLFEAFVPTSPISEGSYVNQFTCHVNDFLLNDVSMSEVSVVGDAHLHSNMFGPGGFTSMRIGGTSSYKMYCGYSTSYGFIYNFTYSVTGSSVTHSLWLRVQLGQLNLYKAYYYIGVDISNATWSEFTDSVYLVCDDDLNIATSSSDIAVIWSYFVDFFSTPYVNIGKLTISDSQQIGLAVGVFGHSDEIVLSSFGRTAVVPSMLPLDGYLDTIYIEYSDNLGHTWYGPYSYVYDLKYLFLPSDGYLLDDSYFYYPLYTYRVRASAVVDGVTVYTPYLYIDSLYSEYNADFVEFLYHDFYDIGTRRGYQLGLDDGETIGSNAPGTLVNMVFSTIEIPFKILLGEWDDTQHKYVNGLVTFNIFGVDLRDFLLSLIAILFFVRVWTIFASGSLPNLFSGGGGYDSHTATKQEYHYNEKGKVDSITTEVDHHKE